MRRIVVGLVLVGLFAATLAPSAHANHKKISESYTAAALPFPVGSYDDGEGCIQGVDNVHKVSHDFEAPFPGILTVKIGGYQGDWDLFVLDAEGEVIVESSQDIGVAETVKTPVKSGETVTIVVCNWAAEPVIQVDYTFVHKG